MCQTWIGTKFLTKTIHLSVVTPLPLSYHFLLSPSSCQIGVTRVILVCTLLTFLIKLSAEIMLIVCIEDEFVIKCILCLVDTSALIQKVTYYIIKSLECVEIYHKLHLQMFPYSDNHLLSFYSGVNTNWGDTSTKLASFTHKQ